MSIKSLRTGYKGISALAGNLPPGDFESIASASGTGSSGVITFSSIPSNYQHLQIRWLSKSTLNGSYVWLNFNGDSSSLYANHYLYSDGSTTPITGNDINQTRLNLYGSLVTSSQTNTHAIHIVDILDYNNTNKFKTVRALGGQDQNGSGVAFISSGLWRSSNAITSITITANADNFGTNSRFALYGIRG